MKLSQFFRNWVVAIAMGLGGVAGIGQALARPVGIDVSSYQGYIDWGQVSADGISFAWAKATEGTFLVDGDFTANEANAKASGVYIGAYHFAHPDDNPYSSGADAEANYFWGEAGGYIKGGGTYMVPMLDFETTGSSDITTWVNEWCGDIKSKASANGVTANPVVYTTGSIAGEMGGSVTQWPLWIADPNGESSQSGSPTVNLSPWGTWTFWQYSWTGSVGGISGDCDEDVINGDDATLQAFVIGTGTSGNSGVYYWDYNGGAGWSPSVAHWSTSSGGGNDIDWTDGKYAYFSAGNQAKGSAGITMSASGLDTTGIKIAQGTLTFNESQMNLDAGPDKANYCLISVASGLTATFNCVIGQNGTVGLDIDNGGGTLDLTAANSFKGGTYLAEGTLAIGDNGALGGGALNFEGGSIKSSTTSAHTLHNTIILSKDTTFGGSGNLTFSGPVNDGGASKTFTVTSGITVEFDGVISDGGADDGAVNTLAGGGTLVLKGANTYNKPTVISSGTMAVGNNSALGVGAINFEGGSIQSASSAGWTLGNEVILSQDTTFGGTGNLNFTGPVNDGGLSKTFTVASGVTVEFSGVISDGGADAGAVNTVAGGGALVFSGANTYNKPTVIGSGTMVVGNNSALGVGAINFGGGSIQSIGSTAYTLTNAVILSQSTTFTGAGNLTFTGPVSDGGASKTLTVNNGITVEFDGAISDGGGNPGALNAKAGGGTLVFGGVNTYNKPTVINSGTLSLGAGGSISNSPSISLAAGATFDVSAAAFTLGAGQTLSGSGAINGNVTVASDPTALLHPGGGGVSATTLAFNNNLTFGSGGGVEFDLSSVFNGANDTIALASAGAVLTPNGASVVINSAGALDTNHDYVLFNLTGSSPAISGSFSTAPVWAGVTPSSAAGFRVFQNATQVVLHYTAPVTPVVSGITNSSGTVTINFACNPGYACDVQRSGDVKFSGFIVVLTTNAPAGGQFLFTEAPPFAPAFYRLRQH